MDTTPAHTTTLRAVLRESKRIFTANSRHFLALSFLFLPLSVSLIVNPSISLSGNLSAVDHLQTLPQNNLKDVISHILYILIVYVLTLSAITTVTYSTYHGFLGNQVTISATLKSLVFSFFPLVATAFVAQILLFLISLTFLFVIGVILILGQNFGIVINSNSVYFMWFFAAVGGTLIGIIVYFHVNWSLAFVVVVAESKWGFSPLMRSSYLVKGMRSISLSLLLCSAIIGGVLVWVYSGYLNRFPIWVFGLNMILGSSSLMGFLVWNTAANTVLYMYCTAFHGELVLEVADGFGHEYINLPSDDEKVAHIVNDDGAC